MYQALQAKKQLLVLTTSILVTSTSKEAQKVRVLNKVLYICYLVQFEKNKDKNILALLNSRSEVNIMILAYSTQLGFKVQKTNIGAQKIDRFSLKTYSIVIATF